LLFSPYNDFIQLNFGNSGIIKLDIDCLSCQEWWAMRKIVRSIFVLVIFAILSTGCFPKSTSNNDQIATGVAKTVAAQNAIVPNTGAEENTPPAAIPPTAVPKVKPTADFRQAALSQFLGTWKVSRVNKSSKGVPWQDVDNQLTFQPDGIMKMVANDGTESAVKYKLDIKQVIFTFDDGRKEYWNFEFSHSDNSLTLSKQGATERFFIDRVQ
jgi:hypothetical protein